MTSFIRIATLCVLLALSGCDFAPPPFKADPFFNPHSGPVRQVYGLGPHHLLGCTGLLARTGDFPLTQVAFVSPRARTGRLTFSYVSVVPGQYVGLAMNFRAGADCSPPKDAPAGERVDVTLPVDIEKGLNVLTISYLNGEATPPGLNSHFLAPRIEVLALHIESD